MRERPTVPAAIIGNSRLLASYSERCELQALYWPHIDYGQHVHTLLMGVRVGLGASTSWFHEAPWEHRQEYLPGTAILRTTCFSAELGLETTVTDFAVPGEEGLVRRLVVRNVSAAPLESVALMGYAHVRLEESHQYNTVLRDGDAVIFYRRDTWLAMAADAPPTAVQAGRVGRPSDAWPQACAGAPEGRSIDCGDVNAGVRYDLGTLAPGAEAELTLFIALGHSRADVAGVLGRLRSVPASARQAETAAWWARWLGAGRQPATGSAQLDHIYRQSLIMLKLMSDERGGGFIAGPECDPEYRLSGGYAYCWGRDAAYMTTALDEAGHHAETEAFFLRWAARAQEESGAWLHRHYVDGTLAPSWGLLQIDEGASILYGAWRRFELTGDAGFARAFWPAVARGAEYLLNYRDPETGLPGHSIDLWEKRDGLHTYSSAAVYAGLLGAARLAGAVGEAGPAARWAEGAEAVRRAMVQHLWSEAAGRFLRTIRLRGTGPAEAGRQDLAAADLPDIALLGTAFPFGAFSADDDRVRRTAELLERELSVPGTGAVYRYVGDQYIGGHPWLICSLWLAIWHLEAGNRERALELIGWVADRATPLGLLPEQVSLTTGRPTWVTPLAWSCAMFVLAVHRLTR